VSEISEPKIIKIWWCFFKLWSIMSGLFFYVFAYFNTYFTWSAFSWQCKSKHWVRWETERTVDGKLCLKHSHQKLLESDNFSWCYNQKCRGCFFETQCRVFAAVHSDNFVVLACTVLIGLKRVTDGRTDGQPPWRWLRRTKHYMLARKNVTGCMDWHVTERSCWAVKRPSGF